MKKLSIVFPLLISILLYACFCLFTVQEVGLVGEVVVSWAPEPLHEATIPTSRLELAPEITLLAQATRPIEQLELGALKLPLMVNAYTGGLADWPALGVARVFGFHAGLWVAPVLGGVLLVLAARFLHFHGTDGAPGAAVLVLASDWSFIFYRKVLGGTEVLLQAAFLLLLWAIWSRRWRGGRHGSLAIGLGIGLGLLAKITFVAPLIAMVLALVLTRKDKAALLPPAPLKPLLLLGIPALLLLPAGISSWHHQLLPSFASHDYLGLQLHRLFLGWQGVEQQREGFYNLFLFLGDPLPFFQKAYGAEVFSSLPLWKGLGFLVTGLGIYLGWQDRGGAPAMALLRFLSILVPLELGLILLLNRDLHHLAQVSLPLAILIGLAADRVAASLVPRGFLRTLYALVLVVPFVLAGGKVLIETDRVIASIEVPSFTKSGQRALRELLERHHVQQLVLADYESYGVLELLCPGVEIRNFWPEVTTGLAPEEILKAGSGGHLLIVKASAPFVYNWTPSFGSVQKAAAAAGVEAIELERLGDSKHPQAVLYRLNPLALNP